MKAQRNLIPLIKPYIGKLLLVVLINIAAVFFSILTFMLIEPFVKLIFTGESSGLSMIGAWLIRQVSRIMDISASSSSLLGMTLFVFVLFFFKNVFFFLAQVVMAPVKSDFVRQIRNKMYDKVLILPISFFSDQKKGDVISRAVNDTQEIEFTVLKALQQLLTDPITILFYLIALGFLHFKLTIFVLVLLPPAVFLIGRITKSLRGRSLEAKNKLGILLAHVEETILGLRIIKGFNAQDHANEVFATHNREFSHLQQRIHRRADLASPLSEFLGVTVVMIILVVGGMIVLNGNSNLSAALFITYIALFSQIINPAKNISTAISNYRRGISALDRIYDVLDAEEVIEQKTTAIPVSKFNNLIEFKDVSFAYRQVPVLQNINCTIPKGALVALVGQSGSGKSTLVDLLPRFYDVISGEIMIDGVNIQDFVIDDLRSLFAIVSQDVILFNDTIFNNIAFGQSETTKEQVIEAAKIANAYDFIMELPDGMDTIIGDRGLSLSGGQRQRISIARAILRNAEILILDEATSAMDTESEKLVQDALDKVMKNRTSIVIAHRLSTIQYADMIMVMEEGRIVEQGSHQALLTLRGRYCQLVNIQYAH